MSGDPIGGRGAMLKCMMPLHPLPTAFEVQRAGPNVITLFVHTPAGVAVYYLPDDTARALSEMLRSQASGLILPPGPMPTPPGPDDIPTP